MGIFDFFKSKKNKRNKLNNRKLIYFEDVYNRCSNRYDLNMDKLARAYLDNICLNCGCILDTEIKNSRNCPECKNKIIVRTDMYSKRKIFLTQDMLKVFEKYDKEVREILFMEKLMKNKISIYGPYLFKFKSLKQDEKSSARDIMYQFANYIGNELDRKAYKAYMYATKLPPQDRVLESFDAIMNFRKANQEYITLYSICMFKEKYNVAISSLTDIIYRDIQIVALDIESNPYHKATIDDFLNCIRVNQIKELIKKSDYTIKDFKQIFLEQKHPFIIPKISNEDSWKYVEMAINRVYNKI